MNMIKTVGDLVKALSAYDQSLPFEVSMIDGTARTKPIRCHFNNDTALYTEAPEVRDRDGRYCGHKERRLVITAIRA